MACCVLLLLRTENLRNGDDRKVIRRGNLKCGSTRAETRFRLKSAGASVQSTTGGRGVRNSGSNAGFTMFRGSVKSTGYPLHSPVSPSLRLSCVTVCHRISTGIYILLTGLFSARDSPGGKRTLSTFSRPALYSAVTYSTSETDSEIFPLENR